MNSKAEFTLLQPINKGKLTLYSCVYLKFMQGLLIIGGKDEDNAWSDLCLFY